MAATIKIKNSSTAGAAPTSSDLVQGELAVNVTDKRLYTENASGTIVELGTNPSVPVTFPDGSASAPSLTNDGDTNTGLFFPAADTVGIATGGSERARVDSSGNLGLGVTPSSWNSDYKSVAVSNYAEFYGRVATPSVGVSYNVYRNSSGSFIYKTSNAAARYEQDSGYHIWYTAGSGTAGATATFTQAMTLDASGNLGIGATSPTSKVQILSTGSGIPQTLSLSNAQAVAADTGSSLWFEGTSSNNSCGFIKAAWSGASTNAGSYLSFGTRINDASGSTEKARIDSSGNLLVGKTSASDSAPGTRISSGGLMVIGRVGGEAVASVRFDSDGSVATFFRGVSNTSLTQVGSIDVTTTSTAYVTSSDYRLKENIAPMAGALAKVAALKPCTYTWKSNGEAGEGFIAHELAQVCPHAVTGAKDAVDADGNPVYQGIDTSFLVATLTAALQELKAELDAAKARITALEA